MTPYSSAVKARYRAKSKATTHIEAREVTPAYAVARPQATAHRAQGAKAAGYKPSGIAAELSPLQTHDLVTVGLPVVSARALMASFRFIERSAVLKAVGISERTLQRGKTAEKLLDPNASDRALRLASIADLATDVLGSRESAERWLSAPATGLDRRKPIELLQSTEGTALVKTLLTRMDYGVYA